MRLDCLLKRLFRRRSNKRSKLRVSGLCEGNPPVDSPHKGPVTRKMFPSNDAIMFKTKVFKNQISIYSGCHSLGNLGSFHGRQRKQAATQVVSSRPASKFISTSASFLSRQPVLQHLASLSRVSQLIISAGYIASASGHSALTMSAPVSEIFLGVWEQYEISNADQLADMLGKKTLTFNR